MKKLLWYTLATLVAVAAFSSCKEKEEEIVPSNVVATVNASELLDAAAAAYAAWEEDTTIPTSLTVGGKTLTLPQYQYALCKLLTNLASGDKSNIDVIGYKEADHPERDSYDQKEIAVTGGPKISEGTEDLVDIAKRMMAAMADKLTVPNQTVITRSGESALAFSTNRATVSILRALAEYKSKGSLPAKVSTEYLSAAASLKGFAQQFVGILDIWEKTVGTVSADGSHCTDNNSAWKDVHFVPIPHSGGAYADGVDQYDAKYQPYFTVTIDGKEYTSAQTWGIALRGIMDMITVEGSAKKQVNRNPFEHTMGNGASFKEPIPAITENDIWGQYPWYESTNDGPAINLDQFTPYLIARCASWFLTRQEALGKIGNYQFFCDDPDQGFVEDGVDGFVSSMRMWLIAARFYKYLLDNNITENVYDAVKNVTFSTDLYGVEMPDIDLKTTSMTFVSDGETKDAKFTAKKAWTATTTESWLKVEPASGDPGSEVTIKVTADPNMGDERSAKIIIKGGNVTDGLEIPVIQGKYIAPTAATIKEFAQEYVKILNVWANTTGTIDMVTGEDYASGSNNVENAHYVPSTTTITVAGKEYNTADMFETALRSYLLVRGYDGLDTQNYGPGSIGAREGGAASMSETAVPVTHDYTWGSWPFNETEGNGGHFRTTSDEHCVVEVAILDNWAMRSLNYSGGKPITNMCGYPRDPAPMSNYTGSFCSQRALLTYAFFFKYMLDNNLDKGTDVVDDTIIRTELFGDEGGEPIVASTTILDFAKEYVKILDVWQKTTGEIVMHPDVPEETVANAHYVPETTTITVGGKVYNTADMWETALRSYLLIRGYDGLETEKYGKNSIPALEGGAVAMSTTPVPETHEYYWGSAPYNETKGNGGHLVMGSDANGEHCKVKVDILDNWAMRSLNFQHGQSITNLCGYAGGQLAGYYGCFSSKRALLTYAFFFKYMLDNNLDKGTEVAADAIIRSELLGDEGPAQPTLKDFAKEFVKGLDVWQATVGTVESEGQHLIEKGTAWENAHFIPIVPNPNCEYLTHAGNQYDPKYTPWVLNVAGQEISSSQAWEIAIRGLMNLVTKEGEAFLDGMTDRNKAYTLGNNQSFSESVIPTPSKDNQWGKHPWYEGGDDERIKYNGAEVTSVDVNFIVKVGSWHVVRSFIEVGNNSPLGMIGNFQQFGTNSSTLNLEGYDGLIAPMREMMVLLRIYKYMLDNNVDANVYDALKDQKFDFDLYGIQ